MKKVLKKNEGFSLVELIVVIVIMLVLAAVMVPNVMKYIGMAGQASTKNDAASMLTQLQADVADAAATALQNKTTPDYTGAGKIGSITPTKEDSAGAAKFSSADTKGAKYYVDKKYQVTAFAYCDGTYYLNWTSAGGWDLTGLEDK